MPDEELQLNFDTISEPQEISISTINVWDVLRIIVILAVIIAITYGIIWFLRKVQRKTLINSNAIEILSSQALAQGAMLYVVKTGSSYLLLGNTGQSIQLIKEFSTKEERDEMLLSLSIRERQGQNATKHSFVTLLRNFYFSIRKQENKDTNAKTKNGDLSSIMSALKEREKKGEKLNGKH